MSIWTISHENFEPAFDILLIESRVLFQIFQFIKLQLRFTLLLAHSNADATPKNFKLRLLYYTLDHPLSTALTRVLKQMFLKRSARRFHAAGEFRNDSWTHMVFSFFLKLKCEKVETRTIMSHRDGLIFKSIVPWAKPGKSTCRIG